LLFFGGLLRVNVSRKKTLLSNSRPLLLIYLQWPRKNPEAHDDLLTLLLNACEEETGRGMTDQQLRDEVMTIFVAGACGRTTHPKRSRSG
jgi:hypothetical protein